MRMGGTIPGTTNRGDPFAFPMPDGSVASRIFCRVVDVPIEATIARHRRVDLKGDPVKTARGLGICLGDT
ncbi:MAG: hypothetical protein V3U93_08745 [Alphaproteobacteria bacterium]